MMQRWNVRQDFLEIAEMPFYWRLSNLSEKSDISSRLPIKVFCREEYDYLEYRPTVEEWQMITMAYEQDENIGFLNPESGQINTYGASVNGFFLDVLKAFAPKKVYEIGCGAGFSIQYLKEHGFEVIGIDPSEYSAMWSKRIGFQLENSFFDEHLISGKADLIYCNDVFEHVLNVDQFSQAVYKSLKNGGVFCFSTTNSTKSIELGDISMLEHQHVNMFTERSIKLLLINSGFSEITVKYGSYGNTFHVVARKTDAGHRNVKVEAVTSCAGFFERAQNRLLAFEKFYKNVGWAADYYVPLRCIPYLAAMSNFGENSLYDSNSSWRGKYIDGYDLPIKSICDIECKSEGVFFIGSMTFYDEIKQTLLQKGYVESNIYSICNV